MELIFETYKITLQDNNEHDTCSVRISPNEGEALKAERRKLYIISTNADILYIGEAHTSILKRFQRGLYAHNNFKKTGKANNGYKGYKWLDKEMNTTRELNVMAVVFNEDFDNKREIVEAIEGELVFLVRQKTGKWPLFQNEIHFNNHEESNVIAEDIFKNAFEEKLI